MIGVLLSLFICSTFSFRVEYSKVEYARMIVILFIFLLQLTFFSLSGLGSFSLVRSDSFLLLFPFYGYCRFYFVSYKFRVWLAAPVDNATSLRDNVQGYLSRNVCLLLIVMSCILLKKIKLINMTLEVAIDYRVQELIIILI